MFSCAFAMEFLGGHPGERTATRRIRHLPKGLPPFNGKGRILMKRTPEHRRRWRKWLVAPGLLLAVLAMHLHCAARMAHFGAAHLVAKQQADRINHRP